ncbi:MAG: TldD/PmbA family protein, partial [Planctomycetota bacterium]
MDHPELALEDLRRILREALSRGGDFAEIFLESRANNRLEWGEGRLRSALEGTSKGSGIRVVSGRKTGFATTTELSIEAILKAARAASEIASQGQGPGSVILEPNRTPRESPGRELPAPGGKAASLREADRAARAEDPAVADLTLVQLDLKRSFLVANSLGIHVTETQRITQVQGNVLARRNGVARAGRAGWALTGNEDFTKAVEIPVRVARLAARKALRMLEAGETPGGPFPVVLAPGDGAILFHEAIGHSLEADIVQSGNSIFASRLGETVAAGGVTLIDDATPRGLGGSFRVDDEGAPAQRTFLIQEGRLVGFLHDRVSALRAGVEPTGNGRRQDFRFPPLPRMTNTYLQAGGMDPEEIISSLGKGLFVRSVGAGQSNTNSGGFTFEVLDADWIEGGKISHPVCHASLVG